jgi:hypothetical protein
MLCEEIYESALALLGESLDPNDNNDYEERAPYLIAAFCTEVQETDKEWRNSLSLGTQTTWNPVCISLDELFPLSDRFACAAAFYVAAMLVVDSDEALSDKLYDRFCDSMSTIDSNIEIPKEPEDEEEKEIPTYILESIKNVYF